MTCCWLQASALADAQLDEELRKSGAQDLASLAGRLCKQVPCSLPVPATLLWDVGVLIFVWSRL